MESVYDSQALEALCRDSHRRKLFGNAFFKTALPLETCLEKAPQLAGQLDFQSLEIMERRDSQRDGATKLVFQTQDRHRVESVILRIASGRTSLCLSSQIGCAAGCAFCATGQSGFIRNLVTAEILDQVLLAKRLLREERCPLRNVVVMGMGEPLHNQENLFRSLEILRDPRFFNLSENHLLVSTVGIPDAMIRFVEHFPNIRLALSLHSARQAIRQQIMPIANRHTLEELKLVLPRLGTFMIEYLLLAGINDGPEDIAALIDFLSGTKAHINLIQFNAYSGAPFKPVSPETREAFSDELKRVGFKVTLRHSLGGDIAAACGQLAGTQL